MKNICMFVVQEYSGEILTTNFNDKAAAHGWQFKPKGCRLSSGYSCNPTGGGRIQTFFVMQEEKPFVITTREVAITPAQEALLEVVRMHSPKQIKKSLRHVKELVLYQPGVEIAQMDLDHCYIVHCLQKAMSKLAKEQLTLKNQ